MISISSFLNKNIKYVFLIIIIILFFYGSLFFGNNLFNSSELDIYVLYNYLSNSSLGGWRLDKIIGSNMHLGDPSFNAWSILSIIYNLPIENKILLHNSIFIALNLYASLSLFYLICFANPQIKKFYAALISCLIFISILRFEFNFVFSWLLVYPTIIFTSIILYKYFNSQKNIYIFQLFFVFFVGFNIGSVFAIQQSLFFSFIFFIIYSIYFKKKILFPYLKIISFSLIILIFTSSWIIYPYLLEKLTSAESIVRTADYKNYEILEINLSLYKLIFNTLFGSFLNPGNISFPDKNLMPTYNWNNSLSVFFNFIFIFYLFDKKIKSFWVFLCKYIILFYLIHIFLSEISPFYHSFNMFILETMSWSKVNIEIYIFQILLLSFFISDQKNKILLNNIAQKIYFWIVLFYLIFFIVILIDIYFRLNLLNTLFLFFTKNLFYLFLNIEVEKSALSLFVNDFYQRLNFIIDYKIVLLKITSLILVIYIFSKKIISTKYNSIFFILIILLNNYLSASYFTPLEKNNFYLWDNLKKENIINDDERIMALTNNYLFNLSEEKVNYKSLDKNEIKKWITRHPIEKHKKHYGVMTPPYLSFSSNISFIDKNLKNDNLNIFKKVSNKVKSSFSSESSFEILQEGIYDYNFVNNLSIKYAYSISDLGKLNLINKNLEPYWNDENLFIYKIKKSLPYSYIPKKITTTNKKFYEYLIEKDTVYLEKSDYLSFKNIDNGEANYNLKIIDNSYFEISYNSEFENILVISNMYDDDWKHTHNNDLKIIKVNNYFTGILLKPGNYKFNLYFDNSKYLIGIYISLISFITLILFKNFFNRTQIKP